MRPLRIHWPAIVVVIILSFCFEAAWFGVFLQPWLNGIGHTREWLMSPAGYNPTMQFTTAILCSLVMAIVLTLCIQASGEQTAKRGLLVAAVLWLGFIATSWAKDYVFEVRTLQLFAINTVYVLIDMLMMGAILGAWKGKRKVISA